MKATFLHELGSAFTGLTAYLFSAFLLLFGGIYTLAYSLNMRLANFAYVLQSLSFLYLILVPLATMRAFAEERHQKTDQLLYALPLSMTQVVLGKYLALVALLALPTAVLCLYPVLLSGSGTVPMAASYTAILGFFCLGAALLAIGLFLSCLTKSPVAAAGLCFLVMLCLYFLESLASLLPGSAAASVAALCLCALLLGLGVWGLSKNGVLCGVVTMLALAAVLLGYALVPTAFEGLFSRWVRQLSLFSRFYVSVTGVLDLTAVVYDATVAAFFLVLTVQVLEKRRWSE